MSAARNQCAMRNAIAHRRRHSVSAGVQSAVDLLGLDALNPRSVLFQVAALREQLEALPGGIEEGQFSPAAKAALQIHTDLLIAEPDTMTTARLKSLGVAIGDLSGLVAAEYFV